MKEATKKKIDCKRSVRNKRKSRQRALRRFDKSLKIITDFLQAFLPWINLGILIFNFLKSQQK